MNAAPVAAPAVVDLAFEISGAPLPREHSLALWEALREAAPSLANETNLGVLPLRAAAAGPGKLVLQRRSRLLLRVAESAVEILLGLSGRPIDVAGVSVTLGRARTRPLTAHATLYAHRVAAESDNEADFVEQVRRDLGRLGVHGEFVVGQRSVTRGPGADLVGFSLMLNELSARESLALQASGLGPHRRLGFGIFVGHR
jgi:CRISPR-associated protein Cas6